MANEALIAWVRVCLRTAGIAVILALCFAKLLEFGFGKKTNERMDIAMRAMLMLAFVAMFSAVMAFVQTIN